MFSRTNSFLSLKMIIFAVFTLSLLQSKSVLAVNNVCPNLEDYLSIQLNPNCWYEEDVELGPNQIIRRYGYPLETYNITTEDGYVITIFRIPNNGSDIENERSPVLLEHAIAGESSQWFNLGSESFAFILANNGYDVWISNCRGSRYSAGHVEYTVYDREYWDFSFHEVGLYELPAIVEFIATKVNDTGRIVYIGESWTTTISYVYASLRPEHAEANLRMIISLAPMAYMKHGGSAPIRAVLPIVEGIRDVLALFGIYGIGPNIQPGLDVMHELCSTSPFILICSVFHAVIVGESGAEERFDTFPLAFSKFPSGLSIKTVEHYAQLMRQSPGRFQYFDYGTDGNIEIYNSSIPPEYPLADIRVPVHLFYGTRDALARENDVNRLYDGLQTNKTINQIEEYTMYNFFAAKNSADFYQTLLEYLNTN